MIVTHDYFTELVQESYCFLEQDYGFSYIRTDDVPRQIFVFYRKEELLVAVKYSRVNLYIEVCFYNDVPELFQPIEQTYKLTSNLMLTHLVFRDNPEFNYKAIMPKVLPLEESAKKTAALLKFYGDAVLSGKEWLTWKEIIGHKR